MVNCLVFEGKIQIGDRVELVTLWWSKFSDVVDRVIMILSKIRSSTSQSCHQYKPSPISVINIDVADFENTHLVRNIAVP